MLHAEVTLWDFLWIIETIIILIAVYIAYKEGEKHGEAKQKKRYALPPKEISPEEFVTKMDKLNIRRSSPRVNQRYRRTLTSSNRSNRKRYL